jgi:hypothetical protein
MIVTKNMFSKSVCGLGGNQVAYADIPARSELISADLGARGVRVMLFQAFVFLRAYCHLEAAGMSPKQVATGYVKA